MNNQYEYYYNLLKDEIIQRQEEGCDVSGFSMRLSGAREIQDLFNVNNELKELSSKTRYVEPSNLENVRIERSDGPRRILTNLSKEKIFEKILGGWLGRCVGCQLGKPVEGWTYQHIKELLGRSDAWPLADYFSKALFDAETLEKWPANNIASMRENICKAVRDDDQDYTILSTKIIAEHGIDFTTEQVGQLWLSSLPYFQVYTAERQAYRNLVEGYAYPDTATRWNPYREWIGAQIRADGFGYITPGWPEKAAELAFRDAALSHTQNGIYGEMFMAAAISAAFVTENVQECLEIALSEIPRNSRYAEMVRDCLTWRGIYQDWETARQEVEKKYGHYNWVHAINNTALTILALLFGERDFEKTIGLAVSGGWDTDCNGATAGSIMGVMLGAQCLPDKWIKPLNDTLQSAVFGYSEMRISDLTKETARLAI